MTVSDIYLFSIAIVIVALYLMHNNYRISVHVVTFLFVFVNSSYLLRTTCEPSFGSQVTFKTNCIMIQQILANGRDLASEECRLNRTCWCA